MTKQVVENCLKTASYFEKSGDATQANYWKNYATWVETKDAEKVKRTAIKMFTRKQLKQMKREAARMAKYEDE